MRKDSLILLLILIPAGFIMLLLADNFSFNKIVNPFAAPSPYPTLSTNINSSEPITMAPSASQNIEVLSPRGGDSVKSGFAVKGNARVFENVVSIRLTDSEGYMLIQTSAYANALDVGKFGPFEKMLSFQTSATEGTLEVYQSSAKDGSEIDKVTIPLLFK
ncbi:MAG: Gmad2 immunoglobulin-like domain-containing protein [Candidatus Levybacteria bacterium]|nr:Gmad2 immunoglobulin-like domain-containing protein [Candidatus Levybacteria bacterium]